MQTPTDVGLKAGLRFSVSVLRVLLGALRLRIISLPMPRPRLINTTDLSNLYK